MLRSVFACLLLMIGCAAACQTGAGAAPGSDSDSIYTTLHWSSCKKIPDQSHTDVPFYILCPGVADYRLQIRLVESGRLSINVVNPAKRVFPLHYDDFITRRMDALDDKAEWRVHREGEKVVPVALIVRIFAHEDLENPEKVTRIYWAVAKIGSQTVCVTDRIREGSKTAAEVRALADSAGERSCAAPLPVTRPPGIR